MSVHQLHRRELLSTNELRHLGERQSVRHRIQYRKAISNHCPRMVSVTALRWDEARDCIRRVVASRTPPAESVLLDEAVGRVLAEDIHADRAYPPFPRSMRDGFAVQSTDVPGRLRVAGEIRAGMPAARPVKPGECVEIMTGAPVPEGADAVLMVEHADRDGESIDTERSLASGENISPAGCEASAGQPVLAAGTKIDYGHAGVLASVGALQVKVYAKPTVSIITTGDELVEVNEQPEPYQIGNSNSYSLAAQVQRAGGAIIFRTVARDTEDDLRSALDRGLESDLILLSGGVSAGKYDLVEAVLAEYGAEFHFTRVKIQPGQPAVFGQARGKFFFGLPGNPASTMVTFELFARLALNRLAGIREPDILFTRARLANPFRHKTGLTRFLPATLCDQGETVTPLKWQGSGDVFTVARANAFLVADADRESWGTR